MKTYPASVSRTLNPSGLALTTVVGQHDRKLSDADINLIQDLADLKRQLMVAHQTPSGCLSAPAFVSNSYIENQFQIPAFDVLFRGEILTVGGHQSSSKTSNTISLPSPKTWTAGGAGDPATIFVAFLELWYTVLDPNPQSATYGQGYYQDPTTGLYYYPGGCVSAMAPLLTTYPDVSVDRANSLLSTTRVQLQWRIQVAPLSLGYDFTAGRYGLDPDVAGNLQVYGQGNTSFAAPVFGDFAFQQAATSPFTFQPLLGTTGEPCLWRAGDGNAAVNVLQTLDGYVYAMPLALIFQRNRGIFDQSTNPFGSASTSGNPLSGLYASGDSGRLDGKYADLIYPQDIIDTRLTVALNGYDFETMADQGVSDLLQGNIQAHISRGETPGCPAEILGSMLPYTIMLGPTVTSSSQSQVNYDQQGPFDGYFMGLASDNRSYTSVRVIPPTASTAGASNNSWGIGDSFKFDLDADGVVGGAFISNVLVQGIVDGGQTSNGIWVPDGTKSLLSLYGEQVTLSYGTKANDVAINRNVVGTIAVDLAALGYHMGSNPIIVSITVTYPAGSGLTTRKVSSQIDGGILADPYIPHPLPVFGVSEYAIKSQPVPRTQGVSAIDVINPMYSTTKFGLRVYVAMQNLSSALTSTTVANTWTMSVPRTSLDGRFTGLYPVQALDASGNLLKINSATIYEDPATHADMVTVVFSGNAPTSGVTTLVMLCTGTVQVASNPAVLGLTAFQETVVLGSNPVMPTGFDTITPDTRLTATLPATDGTNSTFLVYADRAQIQGFAGWDNGQSLIWVYQANTNSFIPYPAAVEIYEAVAMVQAQGIQLTASSIWFMTAAILPVLPPATIFKLQMSYLPYQGEGIEGRTYTLVHAQEQAMVTTNGTGSAPVIGLQDVYPFDREYPISTALPALSSWSDSDLKNTPLTGSVDSNYIAKQFQNVEHTFKLNLHTNDFVAPLYGKTRKQIKLKNQVGRRGFANATPHVGFAIPLPVVPSSVGENLMATSGPATLYVDNVNGSDQNNGTSPLSAYLTIRKALDSLPPVIRNPISIILINTPKNYSLGDFNLTYFDQALIGDGQTRAQSFYSLGAIAFSMQQSARITIGVENSSSPRVIIDGSGVNTVNMPYAAANPILAFYIEKSRVIFNGIQFMGFNKPDANATTAVDVVDSDVEFINCLFTGNLTAVKASEGSQVTFNGGEIQLDDKCEGVVLSQSSLTVSGTTLTVLNDGDSAGFFVAERNSSMDLENHALAGENNVLAKTLVAWAQTNSVITCQPTWVSSGMAKVSSNSTLETSPAVNPFQGSVEVDSSSVVVADLS